MTPILLAETLQIKGGNIQIKKYTLQ